MTNSTRPPRRQSGQHNRDFASHRKIPFRKRWSTGTVNVFAKIMPKCYFQHIEDNRLISRHPRCGVICQNRTFLNDNRTCVIIHVRFKDKAFLIPFCKNSLVHQSIFVFFTYIFNKLPKQSFFSPKRIKNRDSPIFKQNSRTDGLKTCIDIIQFLFYSQQVSMDFILKKSRILLFRCMFPPFFRGRPS